MRELQNIDSCVEVVMAELAALCYALQQHKKNVSVSVSCACCTNSTVSASYVALSVFQLDIASMHHSSITLADLNIFCESE